MHFELTYAVSRTFEIPDGASDEEYDAMKETVITGIVVDRIKVFRQADRQIAKIVINFIPAENPD